MKIKYLSPLLILACIHAGNVYAGHPINDKKPNLNALCPRSHDLFMKYCVPLDKLVENHKGYRPTKKAMRKIHLLYKGCNNAIRHIKIMCIPKIKKLIKN